YPHLSDVSVAPHASHLGDRLWVALMMVGLFISACDPLAAQTTLWPAVREGVLSTPEQEQRIAQMLSQMSLEEKVGQMLQPDIASVTPADVQTYRLGAVLAGGNAAPHGDVRTSPQA